MADLSGANVQVRFFHTRLHVAEFPIESRPRHPRPAVQKGITQASKPWRPACAKSSPYSRYALTSVNIEAQIATKAVHRIANAQDLGGVVWVWSRPARPVKVSTQAIQFKAKQTVDAWTIANWLLNSSLSC